jgi:hypothetical protein
MNKRIAATIGILICIVFVGVFALMILALSLLSKGCNHVVDHGLKQSVERVWEGPTNSNESTTRP